MGQLGKLLIIAGSIILLLGVLLYWHERIPWLGKLPGDIIIKRKNFSFYFPIVTSLVISLVLSLLIFLINKVK